MRILVFHRALDFVHDSIPAGVAAIRDLGSQHRIDVDATDDPAAFAAGDLDGYAAVVFLQTCGDVLPAPSQRVALEGFVAGGGGFFGIHGTSLFAADWPWFATLVGASFKGHTRTGSEPAVIHVEAPSSPLAAGLVDGSRTAEEWYGFHQNPRPHVHVVATVDETTYDPHTGKMGGDHPVAWWHERAGGRAVYTALGHNAETWGEQRFRDHILGGIALAARRDGRRVAAGAVPGP